MSSQSGVQILLQQKLLEARGKNPAYSLRAFARRVGLDSGALSGILRGTRRVSLKKAKAIAERLALNPYERACLMAPFEKAKSQPISMPKSKNEAVHVLKHDADHFEFQSEPQYYALLSLLKTKGFRNDPIWIARRLGMTEKAVTTALDRMLRLGVVEENARGGLVRKFTEVRTSDDLTNLAVRKGHVRNLQLAQDVLETRAPDERDFTSLTLACDASDLQEAKADIRNFIRNFDAKYEKSEASEVFQLQVQFIPMTHFKSKEKTK